MTGQKEENKYDWQTYDSRSVVKEMDDQLKSFMDRFNEMNREMAEKIAIAFSGGFKPVEAYKSRPE